MLYPAGTFAMNEDEHRETKADEQANYHGRIPGICGPTELEGQE